MFNIETPENGSNPHDEKMAGLTNLEIKKKKKTIKKKRIKTLYL